MSARFVVGDVREVLASMPDGSVDLVMTSPPFLALRSYLPPGHPDKDKEIGSEPTPADFLDTMLGLTEEWGRVLTPHGSICVELGDTYAGSGGAGGDYYNAGLREGQPRFDGSASRNRAIDRAATYDGGASDRHDFAKPGTRSRLAAGNGWPLDKSLCLLPSLYAASLAYGRNLLNPTLTFAPWRVRNLVAWVRPNPPVGALGDKVRPATSYLTWATRARDRWFDLDAVRTTPSAKTQANLDAPHSVARTARSGELDNSVEPGSIAYGINPAGAPPLDWWCIPPGGYQGSHYAVYPEELCRIPIEASCPRRVCRTCGTPSRRIVGEAEYVHRNGRTVPPIKWASGIDEGKGAHSGKDDGGQRTRSAPTTGWSSCGCPGTDGIRLDGFHTGTGWRPGVALDPFAGSGTTLVVATGRGRDAIGIDLDERNADLARERCGMFLEVEHHKRETVA